MSKVAFYIQFRRVRGSIEATKMTKSMSRTPRGSGAVSVKFIADIPSWVFDPLDLVAEAVVPAEHAEPVIRLDSVGPIVAAPETGDE